MSSSHQSTKLQEARVEILSLLNVLSDKVDLERKFGADYLPLATIAKNTAYSAEDVRSPLLKPHFDTNDERITEELSRSEKSKKLKNLDPLQEQEINELATDISAMRAQAPATWRQQQVNDILAALNNLKNLV